MSPVDPLGSVTRVAPGVDPERRPTAPPPKRGGITAKFAAGQARHRELLRSDPAYHERHRQAMVAGRKRAAAPASATPTTSASTSQHHQAPDAGLVESTMRQQESGAPPVVLRSVEQTPVVGLTVPKGALPPPIVSAAPDAGNRQPPQGGSSEVRTVRRLLELALDLLAEVST